MDVGVVIVVRKRAEEEVVAVVGDQLPADAGGVRVARSGARESGPAGDLPGRVELTVEELVRPPHRMAEVGGHGDPAHEPLEAELVAPPAAVDEERRAGRAHPRVPEPVAMSEQATGVTEGKAETQSPIRVPRSSRAVKLGARSSADARSSMSVRRESTTMRQSFREVDIGGV